MRTLRFHVLVSLLRGVSWRVFSACLFENRIVRRFFFREFKFAREAIQSSIMVYGVANPHEMGHSRSPYDHGRAGVADEYMDDTCRPSIDPLSSATVGLRTANEIQGTESTYSQQCSFGRVLDSRLSPTPVKGFCGIGRVSSGTISSTDSLCQSHHTPTPIAVLTRVARKKGCPSLLCPIKVMLRFGRAKGTWDLVCLTRIGVEPMDLTERLYYHGYRKKDPMVVLGGTNSMPNRSIPKGSLFLVDRVKKEENTFRLALTSSFLGHTQDWRRTSEKNRSMTPPELSIRSSSW